MLSDYQVKPAPQQIFQESFYLSLEIERTKAMLAHSPARGIASLFGLSGAFREAEHLGM